MCVIDDAVMLIVPRPSARLPAPSSGVGGREALAPYHQLPRAALCDLPSGELLCVRAAPTRPCAKLQVHSRGNTARGRALLDRDQGDRSRQGPGVGAVRGLHTLQRWVGMPADDGSADPKGTGHLRSGVELCRIHL